MVYFRVSVGAPRTVKGRRRKSPLSPSPLTMHRIFVTLALPDRKASPAFTIRSCFVSSAGRCKPDPRTHRKVSRHRASVLTGGMTHCRVGLRCPGRSRYVTNVEKSMFPIQAGIDRVPSPHHSPIRFRCQRILGDHAPWCRTDKFAFPSVARMPGHIGARRPSSNARGRNAELCRSPMSCRCGRFGIRRRQIVVAGDHPETSSGK